MTNLSPRQFSPAMMPQRKPEPQVEAAPSSYSLTRHAAEQATAKGFSHEDVLEAANNHQTRYENGRYPDQYRHIRGNIVAVVHEPTKKIRTVYENVAETDLRPDQTDRDAQRYGRNRARQG